MRFVFSRPLGPVALRLAGFRLLLQLLQLLGLLVASLAVALGALLPVIGFERHSDSPIATAATIQHFLHRWSPAFRRPYGTFIRAFSATVVTAIGDAADPAKARQGRRELFAECNLPRVWSHLITDR